MSKTVPCQKCGRPLDPGNPENTAGHLRYWIHIVCPPLPADEGEAESCGEACPGCWLCDPAREGRL